MPYPQDARLRELQFLAEVERRSALDIKDTDKLDRHDRAMIAHLIHEGYVNGVGIQALPYQGGDWERGRRELETRIEYDRWRAHIDLVSGQPVSLRMAHKGRLRISELEQALQTGRERDPTGLMWSKRHLDRDLAIAVLSARTETPVSVAFLDMNGLKAINDGHGHAAGDVTIRTYLQVLATICGDGIEGYRGDGGDEVVLVLRATPTDRAGSLVRDVLLKLATEKVEGVDVVLTASCGIASTRMPGEDGQGLNARADKAQYRAKEMARKADPKTSVIAIEDGQPHVIGTI